MFRDQRWAKTPEEVAAAALNAGYITDYSLSYYVKTRDVSDMGLGP